MSERRTMSSKGSKAGLGFVAGGQVCENCDGTVGIADVYCRWCGTKLREAGL